MRPLPPLLCVLVLGSTLSAEEPARTASPEANSQRIRQAVADKLPKYTPPATTPPEEPAAGAGSIAPTPVGEYRDELLVMPEFRVSEQKVFGPDEDDWLTGAELTRKAIRLAERDTTALDLALNRWHIPYLSPSFAARARATYEQNRLDREMDRLLRLVELGELIELDPGLKDESLTRTKPLLSIPQTLDLTRRGQ